MIRKEIEWNWESISISASALIALMRKRRTEPTEIIFSYADETYCVGVDPSNGAEPFYWNGETYPSMIALCSTACIEGGFLLTDLQQPLQAIAVNRKNPAAYFADMQS